MQYFESERLIIRDWSESDLPSFRQINIDPEVMEFFPKPLSEEDTDESYRRILAEFHECGWGLYAVQSKEAGEFVGFIGFHRAAFQAEFTPCVEIGWRLKRSAWGKGYATEGAKACLAYAFKNRLFDKVYSFTAKINRRSENVMKKIGMEKLGEFPHPNVPVDSPLRDHVLYMVDAESWKQTQFLADNPVEE